MNINILCFDFDIKRFTKLSGDDESLVTHNAGAELGTTHLGFWYRGNKIEDLQRLAKCGVMFEAWNSEDGINYVSCGDGELLEVATSDNCEPAGVVGYNEQSHSIVLFNEEKLLAYFAALRDLERTMKGVSNVIKQIEEMRTKETEVR